MGGLGRLSRALLVAAALLAALSAGTAAAQTPPDQLLRQAAGPYEITVSARLPEPVAGLGSRFTIDVATLSSGAPVAGAEARLTMWDPQGVEAGQVVALSSPSAQGSYQTLVRLDQAGIWRFAVTVTSSQGVGVVEGTLKVREAPTAGGSGTLVWALVLAVLVGGGLLAGRSLRRRRPPSVQGPVSG